MISDLLEDLYDYYYLVLKQALTRSGCPRPDAKALTLMLLFEGTMIFLGEGRRWEKKATAVRNTILEWLDQNCGGS